MMNDTRNEYNKKNTYKNNVLGNTWRLGGSWNLVTLKREESRGKQKKNSGGLLYLEGIP